MTGIDVDLELALLLADRADAITLDHFQSDGLRVMQKPDRTPVTEADLAVELALRDALGERRPADGILGEERGGPDRPTSRLWVLDPIDGTKNFVRGVPVWATLISLVIDREPVLGVVSAPALGRHWWAAPGVGAWGSCLGSTRELYVSQVRELDDAYMSTTEMSTWREFGSREAYLDLADQAWQDRGFGDFWSHCLVAEGALDIAVEPVVNAWDIMAPAAVVRAAGGHCTDVAGRSLWNGVGALSTNGLLHDPVVGIFNSRPTTDQPSHL
jgi:histidinol-phosphatase